MKSQVAFSYGGHCLDSSVDGFTTLSVSGRGGFTRAVTATDLASDGAKYLSSRLESKKLTIKFFLKSVSLTDLMAKVGKLKSELDRAQIIDSDQVDSTSISFGTKIALKNLITGEDEFFTILGPWESDPEHQVISYLSPLGKHLLNHKTGEKLNFTINERKFSYEVVKVEKADF